MLVSGSTITFTAPDVAGNVVLTLTSGSLVRNIPLTVLAAGVNTPAITSPVNNYDAYLGPTKTITFASEAFQGLGVADTHLNSDWELATDAGFTNIAQSSLANTSNKTSWTLTFDAPSVYYVRVRHRGVNNGDSLHSSTVKFTLLAATVAMPTITNPASGTAEYQSPNVTFTTSAFAWLGVYDAHLNSDWQLATDAEFTTVVMSSLASTTNLTTWPVTGLSAQTTYYARVRHRGAANGVSFYSPVVTFTTTAEFASYIATPAATPAAFGDPFEGGFYTGMIWNEAAPSVTSTTIATGQKIFTVPDMTDVPVFYAGQTLEVRSRANPANKMIGTVASAGSTVLKINVSSVVGTGTFTDWSIMARYRVIVAPKSSGETTAIAYKNANSAEPAACITLSEGRKATLAMVAAGTSTVYPAAHWCNNRSIAGKTDWYLPARDELELCWRNLKPTAANHLTGARTNSAVDYKNLGSFNDATTGMGANLNSHPNGAAYTTTVPGQVAAGKNFRTSEAEAFIYGGSFYWSSSEFGATSAWRQHWHSNDPGRHDNEYKANTACVRAVRRSII